MFINFIIRMNHSGEGLLIYRRGKSCYTSFETLRSWLQVELHGDESLERLPLAFIERGGKRAPKEQIRYFADNLSGKGQRQAKEKADCIGLFFYPCFSRDHFIYLKWFYFSKKENKDGDSK